MCDELASLVVLGAVTVEQRATGESVAECVERHALAGDERRVVAQHRLGLCVAGQRVHPLAGQPDHGAELTQPRVVRVGIDDRAGAVDVRAVGGYTVVGLRHRRSLTGFGWVGTDLGSESHNVARCLAVRMTVRSGRTTADVARPRRNHRASSLCAVATCRTAPRSSISARWARLGVPVVMTANPLPSSASSRRPPSITGLGHSRPVSCRGVRDRHTRAERCNRRGFTVEHLGADTGKPTALPAASRRRRTSPNSPPAVMARPMPSASRIMARAWGFRSFS